MKRAAALIGTVTLTVLLAGCSSPEPPPASASVVSVTHTYLAAARAHKCDVTKALTENNTFAWCTNPSVRSYKIKNSSYVVDAQAGVPQERCVDTTLTSKGTGTSTTFNGTIPWSFCYVKTSGGWRLRDQGQG